MLQTTTAVAFISTCTVNNFNFTLALAQKHDAIAALHGRVEEGRNRGRQRKIWMDNIREDLKEKNIDITRIGKATRNRKFSRRLVKASPSPRWWRREKKKKNDDDVISTYTVLFG